MDGSEVWMPAVSRLGPLKGLILWPFLLVSAFGQSGPGWFIAPDKNFERHYFKGPDDNNGLAILLRAFDLAEKDRRVTKLAYSSSQIKIGDPGVRDQISGLTVVLAVEAKSLTVPFNLGPLLPSAALPETGSFVVFAIDKKIARATANASEAWFGAGDTGKATRSLLLELRISHKTLPISTVSMLGSAAMELNSYREFEAHLSQLNLMDVDAILHADFLAPISLYQQAIVNDGSEFVSFSDFGLTSMDKDINKPLPSAGDPEAKKLYAYYRSLSPAQRKAFAKSEDEMYRSAYHRLAGLIGGPEHGWPFDGVKLSRYVPANSFAGLQIETASHDFGLECQEIARSRTQARLLRLHAYIQKFRLTHGRLPRSLDEMRLPKAETYDPLAAREFLYQARTPYRLASGGVRQTGPIELDRRPGKYSRGWEGQAF